MDEVIEQDAIEEVNNVLDILNSESKILDTEQDHLDIDINLDSADDLELPSDPRSINHNSIEIDKPAEQVGRGRGLMLSNYLTSGNNNRGQNVAPDLDPGANQNKMRQQNNIRNSQPQPPPEL